VAQGGAGGDGAVPTDGLTYHMQSLWALVRTNTSKPSFAQFTHGSRLAHFRMPAAVREKI
jgi:hypothetical protein